MFEYLKQLDRDIFLAINSRHSVFMDALMWQLSKDWPMVLIVLLVAYLFYRKYQLRNAAALILGVLLVLACTDLSTNLIKHQVKRYRPSHNIEIKDHVHVVNGYKGGTYGFFSSHAANVFGITTFLFICSNQLWKHRRWLFYLLPSAVGYSRIYLGVHYPSDVLTGFFSGLIFGYLIYMIIKKYFFKFENETI